MKVKVKSSILSKPKWTQIWTLVVEMSQTTLMYLVKETKYHISLINANQSDNVLLSII